MADLTITPANIKAQEGASVKSYKAGEAITPGHWVYKLASTGDNRYFLADNASPETAQVAGMAVSYADANDMVQVVESGPVNMGAILTKSEVYGLSANPGKTAPLSDLASGEYRTTVGFAKTTSIIQVAVEQTGISKA